VSDVHGGTKFAGATEGEGNRPQRVVAIVGGTFDPIHFGHLRMALESADRLNLDEVRFIPSARPPHRGEPDASDRQRLEMVELAIADEDLFVLDDREYRREGVSYMVDTLESLRAEMGDNVSLILIMGSDAFLGLASWHRWQRLLKLVHIVVVTRPGDVRVFGTNSVNGSAIRDLELQKHYNSHLTGDLGELHVNPCGSIYTLETTALGISASNIRNMIAAGQSPKFLLPGTVLSYINERNLYRL